MLYYNELRICRLHLSPLRMRFLTAFDHLVGFNPCFLKPVFAI